MNERRQDLGFAIVHEALLLRFLGTLIVASLASLPVQGQSLNSLPHFQPSGKVSGVIRAWGDDRMDTLMKYWEAGFRKYDPDVRFETRLMGTDTGMAGLYTSVSDLALMGREATSSELMAFEWVFQYKPLQVEVATGSLDVPGKAFAVTIFVHRDNPITRLTFQQLDAIFDSDHRRSSSRIRTWGELGLTGAWKDKPIHPYGFDFETGTGWFFRRMVFNGSDKWNCDVKEFADLRQRDGTFLDASGRILDALAQDPYGIAYSNLGLANSRVRPVAVSSSDSGPFVEPSKESLFQRNYPLTRGVSIYINRRPGKAIDPKIKEFLRYVLSQEGQQAVHREGDFLPLNREIVHEQLQKLN